MGKEKKSKGGRESLEKEKEMGEGGKGIKE